GQHHEEQRQTLCLRHRPAYVRLRRGGFSSPRYAAQHPEASFRKSSGVRRRPAEGPAGADSQYVCRVICATNPPKQVHTLCTRPDAFRRPVTAQLVRGSTDRRYAERSSVATTAMGVALAAVGIETRAAPMGLVV